MKREIKFRGIDYDGNWQYGDLCTQDREHEALIGVWQKETWSYCRWIPVKAETVGEYTGLKDKNGKEIYEGDVLIHDNGHSKGAIEWDNFYGSWIKFYPLPHFAVIGNIYENPQLIT